MGSWGKDEDGNTALILATKNGRCYSVWLLLSYGANRLLTGEKGAIPLHYAITSGCFCCTINLISPRTVNVTDDFGRTALHFAAMRGFLNGILFLHENGAQILLDKMSRTPFHWAIRKNQDLAFKKMVELWPNQVPRELKTGNTFDIIQQ